MKKTFITIVSACLLIIVLAACGKGGVRDDVAVADLTERVKAAIESGGQLAAVDASYVKGMMGMDESGYAEYSVNINTIGMILDEFGIFKGEDGDQTAAIEEAIKVYIQQRKDSLMPEYLPEENPKIEGAEYRVIGNYVIYAMLSDSEREAAFKAVEDGLK